MSEEDMLRKQTENLGLALHTWTPSRESYDDGHIKEGVSDGIRHYQFGQPNSSPHDRDTLATLEGIKYARVWLWGYKKGKTAV